MRRDDDRGPHLCFVESQRLRGPFRYPLDVWTEEGQRIGCLDGVVVDAEERRARYLVVDRGRFRPSQCLVPLPARLDLVHQALCVDVDDADADNWPPFDSRAYPRLAA